MSRAFWFTSKQSNAVVGHKKSNRSGRIRQLLRILLVKSAWQRRSLAMDLANLASFQVIESWVQYLFLQLVRKASDFHERAVQLLVKELDAAALVRALGLKHPWRKSR